ncbi:MAG: NAD(P)H-dependent glycerol-3-phosphate dehydrogenase [Dehalococcoidia bacterium]|nr:NAD(P)H-dependent glycerol-3-phosphate dehydrogenase [Dehalococcoidia bacterium]
MPKVAVVGTTSWGTCLSIMMARNGIDVTLWARTSEEAEILSKGRHNQAFLPNVDFPESLSVTCNIEKAIGPAALVILAVPSQSMRQNIRLAAPFLQPNVVIVSAAKGLELGTLKRMTEVIGEEIPQALRSRVCALSGPNLAREIIMELPAATAVACKDLDVAAVAQRLIMTPTFRVYTNADVVGIELGGSLKNIIALGAGMSDGLGYGDNGKSAFITRGLTEIARLGVAAGANPLTFAGLAGMGDLIVTCISPLSRNHFVGEQLAKGRYLQEILDSMHSVAEGVSTTVAARDMARGLGVEMPLTEQIYCVLFEGLHPRRAVAELMLRDARHE